MKKETTIETVYALSDVLTLKVLTNTDGRRSMSLVERTWVGSLTQEEMQALLEALRDELGQRPPCCLSGAAGEKGEVAQPDRRVGPATRRERKGGRRLVWDRRIRASCVLMERRGGPGRRDHSYGRRLTVGRRSIDPA